MFYCQILCLFFLTSTAYSAKLAEEIGTTLEQFSDSDTSRNRRQAANDIGGIMSRRNTLTVDNGGDFGSWGVSQFCSNGAYAVGYDLKIEPKQGNSDDTSLNGIKLYCEFPDGRRDREITSTMEQWGGWQGLQSCTSGNFLTGFQLQVEPYQGSLVLQDDTSANFAKFKCRDLGGNIREYQLAISPGEGFWGRYGSWSGSCPNGQAICGIQTKVEASCGNCDDTALNDAKFYCCD